MHAHLTSNVVGSKKKNIVRYFVYFADSADSHLHSTSTCFDVVLHGTSQAADDWGIAAGSDRLGNVLRQYYQS